MSDTCQRYACDNVAHANCTACGRPTCRRHGKYVGDVFICYDCIDEHR